MPLPDYDPLEQVDLLEAEKRDLLIEFGKEVVHVLASAKDSRQAMSLIEHLKRVYFIGHEEREKRRIKEEADELIRLSQLTFRVSPSKGGGILTIDKGSK